MTRSEVLKEAEKCVCGQRQEDYGTPESSFEAIAALWNAWIRAAYPKMRRFGECYTLTPKDVAMMMALLKVARAAAGDKADNYVDLAGYAACAGEIDAGKDMPIPAVAHADTMKGGAEA